jgi:hypothetical protein
MSSTLVPAIWRALERAGWAALRFNFRGTGRSEGRYGGGTAELRDAAAALDEIARAIGIDRGNGRTAGEGAGAKALIGGTGTKPLAVVGWSFGALVGLAAAVADTRVETYVAVAPPVSVRAEMDLPALPPRERLATWRGRALVICGSEDGFCTPSDVKQWAEAIPSAEIRIVEGEDHLFSGSPSSLAEEVATFVARS